jgi:hypothetical protein
MPEDVKIYGLMAGYTTTSGSRFMVVVDDSDEEQDEEHWQDEDSYSELSEDAYIPIFQADSDAAVPSTEQPSEIAYTPSVRCLQVQLTMSFQQALEKPNSSSLRTGVCER